MPPEIAERRASRQSLILRAGTLFLFSAANKGQSILILFLLVVLGTASSVKAFGAYASLQIIGGYGLTLSLAFVHGRLFFDDAPGERGATVFRSAVLLVSACAVYLAVSALAALVAPARYGAVLGGHLALAVTSIAAYLFSEHALLVSRITNKLGTLLFVTAVRLAGLPILALVIYRFRANAFLAVVVYLLASYALCGAVAFFRSIDTYRPSKIDMPSVLRILSFAASISFDPVCQWVTLSSGRIIVQAHSGHSVSGYVLFSFAVTTLNTIGLVVYDTWRIRLFDAYAKGDVPRWWKSYLQSSAVNAAACAAVLVAALSLWGVWNRLKPEYHLADEWRGWFAASVLGALLYGSSVWGAMSMKLMRLVNVASASAALAYLSVLWFGRRAGVENVLVAATATGLLVQGVLGQTLVTVQIARRHGLVGFGALGGARA
jgi:hypothetical protein